MKKDTRQPADCNLLRILPMLLLAISLILPASLRGESKKRLHHDDLLSVTFPTEKFGWACGRWGTILHSSDGGARWSHQASGTQNTLVSIFFFDETAGWAVGTQGTIVHTEDGGNTWKAQTSPVDFLLRGVCFVSPEKGWIATERTHILYTENAGETWEIQFKDEDFVLKSIDFSDERHGWAAGEFGYIYYTRDGGRTWQRQSGKYELNEDGELAGMPSLFDVVALDPTRALAVGMDGCVMETTDQGESWHKMDVGAPLLPLYCIAANTAGQIVIGGKGVCLYSENQGRHWKPATFSTPIVYSWIYGLTNRGADGGFISAGEQGKLYVGESPGRWDLIYY